MSIHPLAYLSVQKTILVLLLLGAVAACSSEKKAPKRLPVPKRLKEICQISQQTTYPLFDYDTTVNEIRLWESPSMQTNTASFFLRDHSILTQRYYLSSKNGQKGIKVIGMFSSQERILDKAAEKEYPVFYSRGGPAITCHKGVEATIDSLFKLGFADMQSQPEEEEMRVGDGISYIIEMRRGRFYKYVYYHNPEYFDNEPARKFIKMYQFLTQDRWHNLAFIRPLKH